MIIYLLLRFIPFYYLQEISGYLNHFYLRDRLTTTLDVRKNRFHSTILRTTKQINILDHKDVITINNNEISNDNTNIIVNTNITQVLNYTSFNMLDNVNHSSNTVMIQNVYDSYIRNDTISFIYHLKACAAKSHYIDKLSLTIFPMIQQILQYNIPYLTTNMICDLLWSIGIYNIYNKYIIYT